MAQEKHHMVSPSGAALMALSVACFCFFVIFEGWVSGAAAILLAAVLIACCVPQLLAGIFDLLEGNSLFGNTMIYFGSFFMLGSGLTTLAEYLCGMLGWPFDPRILGWVWIVLTLALWGWTPGFIRFAPWHLTIGLLCADVALLMIALAYLGIGGPMMHPIAGWLLCILGLIGIYNGAATVLAETFHKVVLPVGKPLIR